MKREEHLICSDCGGISEKIKDIAKMIKGTQSRDWVSYTEYLKKRIKAGKLYICSNCGNVYK